MKPTIGWGLLVMFLLHPITSATAPRTVASAVSGWIDVGNGGTRFHNTPQALCPNGTLNYESEVDVTCSNANIWGTWAYACPIGYLPDTYPEVTTSAHWGHSAVSAVSPMPMATFKFGLKHQMWRARTRSRPTAAFVPTRGSVPISMSKCRVCCPFRQFHLKNKMVRMSML